MDTASHASQASHASPPPEESWIKRDYQFIKATADEDKAFRFSLIGACLFAVGSLIVVGTAAATFKSASAVLPLAGVMLLLVAAMCVQVYLNYCLVYGHCKGYATVNGLSALTLGVIFFILSVVLIFKRKEFAAAGRNQAHPLGRLMNR